MSLILQLANSLVSIGEPGGDAYDMPRIRTIKPELWDSADVLALDDSGQALFVWLISQADDAGRLHADAHHIARRRHRSQAVIEKRLQQLEAHGMICRYEQDGASYIALSNWSAHQRVDHPTPSRIPDPPSSRGFASPREDSRVSARAPADRTVPEGSNRKGPEGTADHARTSARKGTEKQTRATVTGFPTVTATVMAQLEGFVREGQESAVPTKYRDLLPDIRARLGLA